ncbi:hypothetical protein [Halorientalis regularis]|uniref:hypothetical protein n=1 Tax=Halorientalis regularis TaxID=660518 RepID=UPI001FDFAB1E|nr:hypothetical protein [Halorientalis regularis]
MIYATPDGARYLQKARAFDRFGSTPGPEVTAAITVPADRLEPVDDPEERDRYASEAVWPTGTTPTRRSDRASELAGPERYVSPSAGRNVVV